MRELFKNIRFYVLLLTIAISVAIYLYFFQTITSETLLKVKLSQSYGLLSFTYLYFALLAGPFCYTFRAFPWRPQYLKARRAIGVSAFYFALLHSSIAFFGLLGGFEGLGFLTNRYLLAISLSFTSLLILAAMAATSFDKVIKKITFVRWKLLHRLVYLAGFFVLIHALMLGTHFQNISQLLPQIIFAAIAFLLFLESLRLDTFIQSKFPSYPRLGLLASLLLGFVVTSYIYSLLPEGSTLPLGIHSQHIKLAKQAQQDNPLLSLLPGQQGDRTKRFTASINHPEVLRPNINVDLSFAIYDASSGNKVQLFSTIYEKVAHLIIVNQELNYYSHIHPSQESDLLKITTKFPRPGRYHIYLEFLPLGAIEQQVAFTLDVGKGFELVTPNFPVDSQKTKTYGNYQVSLTYPEPLIASQLSIGQQIIKFTLSDSRTQNPITTLRPYLSSFGHLVMINQTTFDYLHVHPLTLAPISPNITSGPDVEFMPLGLNGPIKPGIYKLFAQFNPDDQLFTSEFTIQIK